MLDDLLAGLFGEAVFGRLGRSRRAQLVARLLFGLVGAGLGAAGAVHFAGRPDPRAGTPMHWSMIAVFVFLACFSLFNVAFGRRWRWPGLLFAASFVSLLVTAVACRP